MGAGPAGDVGLAEGLGDGVGLGVGVGVNVGRGDGVLVGVSSSGTGVLSVGGGIVGGGGTVGKESSGTLLLTYSDELGTQPSVKPSTQQTFNQFPSLERPIMARSAPGLSVPKGGS